MSTTSDIQALIDSTFRFTPYAAGVTAIGAHTTGWRTPPGACIVHLTGMATSIELDGRPIEVAPHDTAIVLPAAVHHRLTSVTPDANGVGLCRWGHLDFRILGGICVLSLFALPQVIPAPRAVAIGDRCAELTALMAAPPVPVIGSLRRTGIGLHLLATIIDHAPLNPHGLTLLTHATRMVPVFAFIDEHLDEPLTREELARVAGLSPSQFHAIFQQIMRRSPMAHVAVRRIERAQVLLVTTDLPIQDIAAKVGFPDPFHFTRMFKRGCGRSPSRYRAEVSLRTI
jgi:AraC-like DNA-binding protein